VAADVAPAPVEFAEPAAPWIDGGTALLLAYGIPAALLLLVTLMAILRLFALRGRSNVIVQQGWLTALAHAQRRMGIKHGTALLASEELKSPVSWGVLRPIILLNEEALAQPIDAEAIIAHELAHVERLDWLHLLIARIVTAMFWFNPLVWLLARQAHQLREEGADDAVLCSDVPCTDYAALLVNAARHEGRGMLLAANGVAPGKGSLAVRVRRILEPSLRRAPARFGWGAGSAAAAVLIAAPLAALTPSHPASTAPETPSALAAVASAQPTFWVPAGVATPAAPSVGGAVAIVGPVPGTVPPPAADIAAAVPVSPATPNQLIALANAGVTAEYIQSIQDAAPHLGRLSFSQLTTFGIHGVTAANLRAWAAAGYGRISYNDVVNFAIHGVTADYIRSMASAGYPGLAPARLVEFRIHGVTPELARMVREREGGSASAEQVVEQAIFGGPGPRGRKIRDETRNRSRSFVGPPPGTDEDVEVDEEDDG
jgi:beta-lactamase regulating signal transducer with metallopeptidase domain